MIEPLKENLAETLARALRAAAALWRPVAMSHCEARHAAPAMREPAMQRCHTRQRRAGIELNGGLDA